MLRGQRLHSRGIQPQHSAAIKEKPIGLIPIPPAQRASYPLQAADFISMAIASHCLKPCVPSPVLPAPLKPQSAHTQTHLPLLSAAWPPLNFKGFDLSAVTENTGRACSLVGGCPPRCLPHHALFMLSWV